MEFPSLQELNTYWSKRRVNYSRYFPYMIKSSFNYVLSIRCLRLKNEYSEIISRCDQALASLRRSRGGFSNKHSVRDELLSSIRNKKAKRRKCVWKHKFVCLAHCETKRVLLLESDKNELFAAGLGEKEIEFENLNCSADEFQDCLFDKFPRLEDGGGY